MISGAGPAQRSECIHFMWHSESTTNYWPVPGTFSLPPHPLLRDMRCEFPSQTSDPKAGPSCVGPHNYLPLLPCLSLSAPRPRSYLTGLERRIQMGGETDLKRQLSILMRQCAIYDALHGNLIRTVSAKGRTLRPAPPRLSSLSALKWTTAKGLRRRQGQDRAAH